MKWLLIIPGGLFILFVIIGLAGGWDKETGAERHARAEICSKWVYDVLAVKIGTDSPTAVMNAINNTTKGEMMVIMSGSKECHGLRGSTIEPD